MNTRLHRAREVERRQQAAAKAVLTRKRRRDARLEHIAAIIASGKDAGPSSKCVICRRRLVDETAVSRGIGSECWGDVQAAIASTTTKAA